MVAHLAYVAPETLVDDIVAVAAAAAVKAIVVISIV